MTKGPLNSAPQPDAPLVGGVYNATPPAPIDGQGCALQLDSQGNLKVNVVVGGGGGASDVNIVKVGGAPTGVGNPLFAELSDGTNPFGTSSNPIFSSSEIFQGASAVSGTNPVFTRPGSPATAQWSHAIINVSGSGATTLVAAVVNQTIRVYKINLTVSAATNIFFEDSTPTALSGTYILTINGFLGDFADGEPLWTTASGKAFQINSSVAVTIGGDIYYSQS